MYRAFRVYFFGIGLPCIGLDVVDMVFRHTLCIALLISEQFSPKSRMPTHWTQSPNQNLTKVVKTVVYQNR